MALKAILFFVSFCICAGGALFIPLLGLVGYILHYTLGPENKWWAAPINQFGIRYSFTLALMTGIGLMINWGKMRFGKSLLHRQEILLLMFLGIIWFSVFVGGDTIGRYTVIDHPSIKMSKIIVFTLLLTHIVTQIRDLEFLFLAFVVGSLLLGLQAYDAPGSRFIGGRLEGIGGSDFRASNSLAAFLAAMIPLIGISFFRFPWYVKILCAVSGAFSLNAIVLTRSRGGLLALFGAALTMMFFMPRQKRGIIIAGILVAGGGFFYLTDDQFINRSKTIFHSEGVRDQSAQSRIEIWKGGIQMIIDNPMGAGAGNFYQNIGKYVRGHSGRDAHSTLIRCGGELGIPGIAVLMALTVNAFLRLRWIIGETSDYQHEDKERFQWAVSGIAASLGALVVFGLTGTLLYWEALWWVLLLPVCLQRSLENFNEDKLLAPAPEEKQQKEPPEEKKTQERIESSVI